MGKKCGRCFKLFLYFQAATNIATGKSRLLELLDMEKQKVAMQLEGFKQRRNEFSLSFKRQRIDSSSGKAELYKVALLVREANKICQLLKKHTVSNLLLGAIQFKHN